MILVIYVVQYSLTLGEWITKYLSIYVPNIIQFVNTFLGKKLKIYGSDVYVNISNLQVSDDIQLMKISNLKVSDDIQLMKISNLQVSNDIQLMKIFN